MRRSNVYALLTHVVEANNKTMTRDALALDRAQLWLFTLRDSCYRIVSHAARMGLLYKHHHLELLAQGCTDALQHLRLRDLKLVVRHVLSPLLQYAPRDRATLSLIASLFDALHGHTCQIASFLLHERAHGASVTERIASHFEQLGMLTNEQKEILADKLIEDFADELLNHFDHVTADTVVEQAQPIEDKSRHVAELGVLAIMSFSTQPVVSCIVRFLQACLRSSSSLLSRRAATMLVRAIPPLSASPMVAKELETQVDSLCLILAAHSHIVVLQIPGAALEALSLHGQHVDCLTSLLGVVA